MSNFDALIQDLVIANRILAREEVVDAYGHVSVRHPHNPNRFLIARSLAPELVGAEDIVELDLDGQPARDEERSLCSSRCLAPERDYWWSQISKSYAALIGQSPRDAP